MLDATVRPGNHLYVVDASGTLWVGEPGGACPGHEALVAADEEVHAAGWLRVSSDGAVRVNVSSGHFMAEDPALPPEEVAWVRAMRETIEACGLTVEWADSHMRPLDR